MKNITKDLKINSIKTTLEFSEPVVQTKPKNPTRFDCAMFPESQLFNGVFYYSKDSSEFNQFHNVGENNISIIRNEHYSVLVATLNGFIWLPVNQIGFTHNYSGDNCELLIRKSYIGDSLVRETLDEVFNIDFSEYKNYYRNIFVKTSEPVASEPEPSEPSEPTSSNNYSGKKYFKKNFKKYRGNKNWTPRPLEEQMSFNEKKDFLEKNISQLKTTEPDDYTCLGCITKNEIDFELITDKGALKVNGTFIPKKLCAFVKHKKGVKFFVATWFFDKEKEKFSTHFKNCL